MFLVLSWEFKHDKFIVLSLIHNTLRLFYARTHRHTRRACSDARTHARSHARTLARTHAHPLTINMHTTCVIARTRAPTLARVHTHTHTRIHSWTRTSTHIRAHVLYLIKLNDKVQRSSFEVATYPQTFFQRPRRRRRKLSPIQPITRYSTRRVKIRLPERNETCRRSLADAAM